MAGVGSTNAMKKGSGNNPFLAFSEADMQGYLNSAYTGCIVKYSGEAIKRQITDINKTVGEYAQNLVFDTTKLGLGAIILPAAIKIDITKNGSSTTQYIYEGWVKDGKVYPSAVTSSAKMLVLASSLNSGADVITVICDGRWQRDAVNDQGKLTLWSYSEDVLFTVIPDANGSLAPFERFVSIVPYIVGELYKVVYGDGVYYYEEFYYISEDRTTGNSDYLAPGKTMYDFTGSLQTGNGSKINPYIANTVDEMNSYLTLAYKGAFVKYIGTSTADYNYGAVYQVADDGDTTRYAILPTLSNPADLIDIAEGKEAISQLGVKMVGTGNVVLRAATTAGMQALFTIENIGKVVQYVGETDVYIKEAIYQIVDTSEFKQYYELPVLTNEATADDVAEGKEFVNSKGVKIIGTAKGGVILNKYVYTFSGNNFDRLRNIVNNAKGNVNIAFVYNNWLWYGSLSFGRPNNQASYIVLSGIAIKADDDTSTDVMYVVADTGNNAIFTITDINGTKTRTKVTSGFSFYVCYYNDTEIK